MKKSRCFLVMAILGQCLYAWAGSRFAELPNEIDRAIVKSKVSPSGLGLMISYNGKPVYAKNEDKKFIPASITKVVTAGALLEEFPVGHQFETKVFAGKPVRNGKLEGDLYLQGGGDAGFVSESMWVLVNDLRRSGVREITGNIVVDDSRFDAIRFDKSRDQTRVDRAYDSPIGAMTFNWSAINVYIRPGDENGAKPAVYLDPESEYFELQNAANTVASGKTDLQVEHLGFREGKEIVRVKGRIKKGDPEKVFYKAVVKPELWAGENFRSFLKRRGISVHGQVVAGKTPDKALLLATNKGKPIGDLVASMMKFSNNYIAEILVKNLGAEKSGPPGTMEKGISVVRNYLKRKGVAEENFDYINPSGLSRKNKLRPVDIVALLGRLRSNFRIFPEFLSGFPISGVDGTLRSRMKGDLLHGQIRAKTGHLSGVAGLAGYVGGLSGSVYEFAFIFNGNDKQAWDAKELFDRILKILLDADKSLQEV